MDFLLYSFTKAIVISMYPLHFISSFIFPKNKKVLTLSSTIKKTQKKRKRKREAESLSIFFFFLYLPPPFLKCQVYL